MRNCKLDSLCAGADARRCEDATETAWTSKIARYVVASLRQHMLSLRDRRLRQKCIVVTIAAVVDPSHDLLVAQQTEKQRDNGNIDAS